MIRLCCSVISFVLGLGSLLATEPLDTLSYALGHQHTLATMAGENDLMRSKEDFENYIRGLNENYHNPSQMNDSSYMMSYMYGGLQAVYMTQGISHAKEEDMPPLPCIIAGLRKVGNNDISLPADTIAAMEIFNRYIELDSLPQTLTPDEKCEIATAIGVLTAYAPGLQPYIESFCPGTAVKENRQAYATGMADILETMSEMPKSAYEIGRMIALSVNLSHLEGISYDFPSFLSGAIAALGLGEELIPRAEVEHIIDLQYKNYGDTVEAIDTSKINDFLMKVHIQPFQSYDVDWTVTAGVVATDKSAAAQSFGALLQKFGIESDRIPGILMAQASDEEGLLCDSLNNVLENYPLPPGFKWFLGRNNEQLTTVGVMQTEPMFSAHVDEAMVDVDLESGIIAVPWNFSEADALKWREFTGTNIGRHIALEINGEFMYAPKVNSEITSGACNVTGLTPEAVNRLFKGEEVEPVEPDVIELP